MFASVNGLPVSDALVRLPLTGVWTAVLALDDPGDIEGPAVLDLGGVPFRGAVRRSSVVDGQRHVHLVGGEGGLSKLTPARGYRDVAVSVPLRDILGVSGERLAPSTSPEVLNTRLPFWATPFGPAGAALSSLLGQTGASWRMLTDGSLWAGAETWPAMMFEHEIISDDPMHEAMRLVTDSPALLPGHAFRDRRVGYVEHTLDGDHFSTLVHFA